MAEKSFVSPANSVLLQVLNTIWHRTRLLRRFNALVFTRRTLTIPLERTCRLDAIGLCNPLEQLINPMLKVFLLIAELLIHSILIFSIAGQPSVLTTHLVLTRPRHKHCALPGTITFTPSIFSIPWLQLDYCQHSLKYIFCIYCSLKYFPLYCIYCKEYHQVGYFPACISSMNV